MAENGVTCSMSRSGNVWDNAAMESFFSSMKTERIGRKTYRTRNHEKADVFDYIERFYNPTRRHSTLGYLSPMDFGRQAHVAYFVSMRPAAAQINQSCRHRFYSKPYGTILRRSGSISRSLPAGGKAR